MKTSEWKEEIRRRAEVELFFADGGEIDFKELDFLSGKWERAFNPKFYWGKFKYRKRVELKPLLFEWYTVKEGQVWIWREPLTEDQAAEKWDHYDEYGKTGRCYNPNTKEFGHTEILVEK